MLSISNILQSFLNLSNSPVSSIDISITSTTTTIASVLEESTLILNSTVANENAKGFAHCLDALLASKMKTEEQQQNETTLDNDTLKCKSFNNILQSLILNVVFVYIANNSTANMSSEGGLQADDHHKCDDEMSSNIDESKLILENDAAATDAQMEITCEATLIGGQIVVENSTNVTQIDTEVDFVSAPEKSTENALENESTMDIDENTTTTIQSEEMEPTESDTPEMVIESANVECVKDCKFEL